MTMGHRSVLRFWPVLLVAIPFLAWIGFAGLFARPPIAFGEELRHPNGLRTAVPQDYKVAAQIPHGFRFDHARQQRLVYTMAVLRAAAMPVLTSRGREVVSSGRRYMIEDMGGGSGGTEYQLTAWKEAEGGWLVVVAIEQTEFGRPPFDAAWAVLERSMLEAP
jgi:hypothetical protein